MGHESPPEVKVRIKAEAFVKHRASRQKIVNGDHSTSVAQGSTVEDRGHLFGND